MNFFEHQDKARKKTKLLVFYFLLAILLIILALNAFIYGSIYYTAQYYPDVYPLLYQPIWIFVSGIVLLIILGGTLIKTITLKGGGLSVAKMVKARPLEYHTKDFKEKRLLNIVEEMSIASGVPIPKLFIMDNELGINAFVAGIKPQDTVMVVTKGALDNLNREELQGVIGHEFSHIFNSDMRINIRLISILAGILAIGVIGEMLMRSGVHSGISRATTSTYRTGRRNQASTSIMIVAIGAGVLIIGYIGLFFGRIIKSAISRQRELLADACSVQFTRYPQGLTSAFKRMQLLKVGSKLQTDKVEDISHLCFGEAMSFFFFKSLFATHPPIDKRIKAIDPYNKYGIIEHKPIQQEEIEESQHKKEKPGQDKLKAFLVPVALTMTVQALAKHKETIKQSIGNPTQAHFEYAQKLHRLIPEDILAFARDREKIELLYYALFFTRFSEHETALKKHIGETLPSDQQALIQSAVTLLKPLPEQLLIPIFDISLATFTEHPELIRQEIFERIEVFANLLQPAPFRFAMLTILGRKSHEEKSVSDKPNYYSFDGLENDVALLFSFLLHFSCDNEQDRQAHFEEHITAIFDQAIEKPRIDSFKPIHFRNILAKLNQLAPELKEKLIGSCVDLILKDQTIKTEESELLRAICECLDTPMPLILFKEQSPG